MPTTDSGQNKHRRPVTSTRDEQRWRGRPVLSACLRAFVVLAPIASAFGSAALLRSILPPARSGSQRAALIVMILVVSTIVLFVTDRLARRLLPLAVLLRLSLAFPNEAPSRLAVARSAAGTRDLEARIDAARRNGVPDEPARAAETILSLIAAVEAHDRATRGHSERVRIYTDMLADELRLSQHDRDRLRWAAMLHDVGKLEVPKRVLNKPGKLTSREWDLVQIHPTEGARLTEPLRRWLGEWAAAIEQHHERWDGSGYPRGLGGDRISYGGRIVAVTDAYETMTAARSYKRAASAAKARAELVRCSGTHFDPAMVRAFLRISVRRLGLASGPLSWLAQTPLLRGIEQAATATGRSVTATATSGAVAGALALNIAPPALPRAPDHQRVQAGATTIPLPAASPGPAVSSPAPEPSGSPSPSPSPTPVVTDSPKARPSPSPSPSPTWTVDPSPSPWVPSGLISRTSDDDERIEGTDKEGGYTTTTAG